MKKVIIAIISTYSATAFTCSVILHNHIYKISKNLDNRIFKSTTCSEHTLSILKDFLSNVEGKLPANLIAAQTGLTQIDLSPDIANIYSLEELMNKEIILGSEKKISDLKSLTNANQLVSDLSLNFEVSCESCYSKLGDVNIKLTSQGKLFWLEANVKRKNTVWVAKQAIPTFNHQMTPTMFEKKIIFSEKESDNFAEMENIRFYQTNKTISPGDILTTNHLSPIRLVKAFSKVRLNVKGSQIELNTTVKAKNSGYLEEFIEVINPKTQKVFSAKIVDYNTVEIEL